VPYAGSGEAARNVSASGVQGAFAFYAQAKPLADSGQVRALAIASPQRIATWSRCDHAGARLSEFRLSRLRRPRGARQDTAADHRLPEQAA